MNTIEITCDACEARMHLSETLLDRISGKKGRVTCRQCNNEVVLDSRGESLVVTEGGAIVDSTEQREPPPTESESEESESTESESEDSESTESESEESESTESESEDSESTESESEESESTESESEEFESVDSGALESESPDSEAEDFESVDSGALESERPDSESPNSDEDSPNSGLDLIDPGFSEHPPEISLKDEEPELEAAASRSPSIPPPLSADLKEKRRNSMAAAVRTSETEAEESHSLSAESGEKSVEPSRTDQDAVDLSEVEDAIRESSRPKLQGQSLSDNGEFEAPVPDFGMNEDEDEEGMVSMGRDVPSTRFANERDATFQSLYPSAEPQGKKEEVPLAPQFSEVPHPPHPEHQASKRASTRPPSNSPLKGPELVVLGTDGALHNATDGGPPLTDYPYAPQNKAVGNWVPWTVAALSLLALAVSLTAQFNGNFRSQLTGSNAGGAEPSAYAALKPPSPLVVTAEALPEPPPQGADAEETKPSAESDDSPEDSAEPKMMAQVAKSEAKEEASPLASTSGEEKAAAEKGTSPEPSEGSDKVAAEAAASKPAPESVPEPAPEPALAPFNESAASQALAQASTLAKSCRREGDPSGMALVSVTFAPSGRVTRSVVSGSPYSGSSVGGCIAQRFRAATVPEFSGGAVTVNKTVTLP